MAEADSPAKVGGFEPQDERQKKYRRLNHDIREAYRQFVPGGAARKTALLGQFLATIIFSSRWLQMPLYLGLILVQIVYVYQFMIELKHLFATVRSIGESEIMLIA